jgi:hypothetical protein
MTKRSPKSLTFLLLVALLLLAAPRRLDACGPFFIEAVFTFNVHPDVPLDRFARGEIGVLQPTYARSYLVAAYRHLAGTGLNAEEQKIILDFWKERLDYAWESPGADALAAWTAARERVMGSPSPEIEVYRTREAPDDREQYLNCQPDAFQTAAATLEERVKKYGAASPLLKDWVRAQDEVFANCSEGRHLPAQPEAGADALLRADRAYQIAAAFFYSAQFDEAERAFTEIARDASSPWRQKAQYLVARTRVRRASLGAEAGKAEALRQAEAHLNQILSDRSLVEIHTPSRRLLNLVRLRLHPEERLRELAREVLRENSSATLKQDLWDYTFLLDKFEGDSAEGSDEKSVQDFSAARRADDLTDWVLTFQVRNTEALEHALQRWEQAPSDAWLVAALSKINSAHPKATTLMASASKVKTVSPAFAAVIFHSTRLMIEAGRRDEARAQLDDLLAERKSLFPPSTLNQLLGLRMKLARDRNEFFKYAQRVPAALSWDFDGRQIASEPRELESSLQVYANRSMFDQDSAHIINEALPLSMLREAAADASLPQHLRHDLAVAAWVRSVLTGDRAAGRELAPLLEALAPELKGYLDEEVSAPTPDARKFSALYAFLKFPGMQPYVDAGIGRQTPLKEMDSYRDNWWCPIDMETSAASSNAGEAAAPASPAFLNEAQRGAAARERERIAAHGTAPNYFCRLAIEWANQSPDDPRVPEALHLAVRATRYGCADDETGPLSKAAFQLLHRKYPDNPWTKKTPYWYKNS